MTKIYSTRIANGDFVKFNYFNPETGKIEQKFGYVKSNPNYQNTKKNFVPAELLIRDDQTGKNLPVSPDMVEAYSRQHPETGEMESYAYNHNIGGISKLGGVLSGEPVGGSEQQSAEQPSVQPNEEVAPTTASPTESNQQAETKEVKEPPKANAGGASSPILESQQGRMMADIEALVKNNPSNERLKQIASSLKEVNPQKDNREYLNYLAAAAEEALEGKEKLRRAPTDEHIDKMQQVENLNTSLQALGLDSPEIRH